MLSQCRINISWIKVETNNNKTDVDTEVGFLFTLYHLGTLETILPSITLDSSNILVNPSVKQGSLDEKNPLDKNSVY